MARSQLIAPAIIIVMAAVPIQSAHAVADVGNVRFVHPSIDPNFSGSQPSYRSLTHSAAGWQFNGEGKIGWVGKPPATVTAKRNFDFAKAGKFLGKKARLLGPLGWVALAFSGIGWVWDEAQSRGWLRPSASSSAYPTGRWIDNGNGAVFGTAEAVCSAITGYPWTLKAGPFVNNVYVSCVYADGPYTGINSGRQANLAVACGSGQVYSGGACVTAPLEPATEQQMDTALEEIARNNPAATAWAWAPGDPVPAEADRPAVTGPASVVGPETVTTTQSPSGTTTVRKTKTADLSYVDDTVKADIRTTTVTTTPDGSIDTKTETEGSDEEVKPSEETDFCNEHPTASACLPRWCEDHPNSFECQDVTQSVSLPDVDLAGQEVTGSWSSEWHEAGSCPADLSTFAFGRQIVWEMSPYCDFASAMRPVVIAVAALGAALWFFQAIRST